MIRNDLEGDIPGRSHRADDGPVAFREGGAHALQGGLVRWHVGRHLREGPTVDVHDKGGNRLGVLDPVLGMLARAGDEEVQVSLGRAHLVGPLPDVEGVEVFPQGSQRIDVLAGHALVNEHAVPDAGVSSRSADEPLKADLPEARVDLGRGASRAGEESVAS